MTTFLVRFFLSLCILLLSGSGRSQTDAWQDASYDHPSSKLSESLEPATRGQRESGLPLIKKVAASEKDNTAIDVTEVREEEKNEHRLTSFKKSRESSNYSVAIFCALTRGYLFSYVKYILIFGKHFSDSPSSRRHLIVQVFLI